MTITPQWRKKIIIIIVLCGLLAGGVFFYSYAKRNTVTVALKSLEVFESVAKLLPISPDTKKEIDVIQQLTEAFTRQDNVERRYLVLLQNNLELRPGGGFLGQYAVVKIKNGQVTSHVFEDANLLDQRIVADVASPAPLRAIMQIKRWKFRDSNFSPDFPTNAEKAKYFYRLAGGNSAFDGVFAVNADVLSHVLKLTGPVTIPGYNKTFTSENAVLDLEEMVERAYLGDDVPAELKQNRKAVMKRMTEILIERLTSLNNIPKIAELGLDELRNKNVMLSFTESSLQEAVASVHWDGAVTRDWDGDYLMVVDANLGALKSDYYIKRRYEYTVDFTGRSDIDTGNANYRVASGAGESGGRPRATLRVYYNHTAPAGNWRTSDYHSWTRVYAPQGSTLNSWLYTGTPQTATEFNKTVFGHKVDALIGRELITTIVYDLPATITPESYHLLVQKQSGVGTVPFTVRVIMPDGKKLEYAADLVKDVKVEFKKEE